MAATKTVPQLPQSNNSLTPRHGVVTLFGYGIQVRVDRGHLLIEDGIGPERYRYRLPRVGHGLRRLVIIGSDGFVTLEALRTLSDMGAALVMLDRRGKVLAVTGPVASSDAKLRRAQALALINGTALKISKELISQKLTGQELLLRDMLHDSATAHAIAQFRDELPNAESIERVRLVEAQAARCYWQAWSSLPVHWPRADERRVPELWKRFGSRISPLTHSPRLAASPPNALLNLLYALLESESRLSAAAMGLDPGIGVLHVDTPNRDSLACDLMEVCRPRVDAFVLNWLQNEPLRKSDFWEDRNGNCRLVSGLATKLAQTSHTWSKFVAPVAEYVAQVLWASISKRASTVARQRIATRLTQQNRREVKGSDVPMVKAPKPERVCRGCGKELQRDSEHCKKCDLQIATQRLVEVSRVGRIAGHTPEAIAKEAATHRRQAQARAAWNPADQPAWLTDHVFSEKIQPVIAKASATVIAKRIGVSRWYAGAKYGEATARIRGIGKPLQNSLAFPRMPVNSACCPAWGEHKVGEPMASLF
jgi:CRISPR-associated endonuclease Cas1